MPINNYDTNYVSLLSLRYDYILVPRSNSIKVTAIVPIINSNCSVECESKIHKPKNNINDKNFNSGFDYFLNYDSDLRWNNSRIDCESVDFIKFYLGIYPWLTSTLKLL